MPHHSPSPGPRPILLGEVLFDCFPDKKAIPGGAPFNVAWHLAGFGASPLLLSRVGEDEPGFRVRRIMADWGMDIRGLQRDMHHPTGKVLVSLDHGQPSYEILPDQAYDHLNVEEAVSALAQGIGHAPGGLIYHGSLLLRTKAMISAVERLIAEVSLPVFVDINLRDPWWDPPVLPGILERARWVKVNREELDCIAGALRLPSSEPAETARHLQATFDIQLLILTQGTQGASVYTRTEAVHSVTPDTDIPIIDTVGAGDAFSAVTILGLLEGWPLPVILDKARIFAERACGWRGATLRDPTAYHPDRTTRRNRVSGSTHKD